MARRPDMTMEQRVVAEAVIFVRVLPKVLTYILGGMLFAVACVALAPLAIPYVIVESFRR